jgi:hypothetical protein
MVRCPICGLKDGFHQDDPAVVVKRCDEALRIIGFIGHRAARHNVPRKLIKQKGWQNEHREQASHPARGSAPVPR